jgi:hypothetical protein
MTAHLKSCNSSCSGITIGMQQHTDFGFPWHLIFITALARGVPTGHLQHPFFALTSWPLAAPVPFGCLPPPPFPGGAVCASGQLPDVQSLETAWMSPSPSSPSLLLPSPLPLQGVAWASAASGCLRGHGRRHRRSSRQIFDQ